VNSISKVEEVTKLAARTTYNSIRQGPYESIIAFKERFNSAHESYVAQDNPKHEDKDSAMDFFRALDNARYGTFKTDLMNSMTSKSVEAPENLNAMYVIALQWLNPSTKPYPNGFATTFATALDIQDKPKGNRDRKGKKEKRKDEIRNKTRMKKGKGSTVSRVVNPGIMLMHAQQDRTRQTMKKGIAMLLGMQVHSQLTKC